MANDLTTTTAALPAERPKWLTPTESSALTDRGTMLPFNPTEAARAFTADRLDELILRHDAALMPADDRKLAARLRALWESTTAPGNITAKVWLAEAGRLLGDLPLGVALKAIDRAALESERGFLPAIAAIRAHADPVVARLRRDAARLRSTRDAQQRPADTATADHPHAPSPLDARTTAEIMADAWPTMGQHETGARDLRSGFDPARPCRSPSREDYLRMGVAPDVLDRLAAPSVDDQREAA